MPIEEYTLENWLKGQIEMYEVEMLYYTEDFEFGRITEEQHKKANIEFEKIHNLQKEAFDAVVDNHFESYKHHFELDVKRTKNKERYIELEKNKVKEWLDNHPELQQRIMINRPDVGYFTIDKYNEYQKEKEYWNPKKDYKYYPADKNIQASLYTKYLKYLEELNPKEFLTLRDFYTEDDDCYRTHMDMLTKSLEADHEKLHHNLPAIVEKRDDKYYFINKRPNQQYLGAFLVHLACKGFLVFGKTTNIELSDIIKRTFNCDSFDRNVANKILNKDKYHFAEKYFVYFPQDDD